MWLSGLIAIGILLVSMNPARARPAYAARENKPCAYCHINPNGGGPRNATGIAYGQNGHSFVGLNLDGPAVPPFKLAWQSLVTANAARVGVGDTAGDGTQRLVLLVGTTGFSVQSWNADKQQLSDDTATVAQNVADMVVGRFSDDRSTSIVSPSQSWRLVGGQYTASPLAGAGQLAGMARLRDGTDAYLTFDGQALVAHHLPAAGAAVDDKGLGQLFGAEALPYQFLDVHGLAAAALVKHRGLAGPAPDAAGVWLSRGAQWTISSKQVGQGDEQSTFLVWYEITPTGAPGAPVIGTKLSGKMLDLAIGPDIRSGGGRGFYILADGAPGARNRTLYYFGLQ